MILVTGPRGTWGVELVRRLAEEGRPARAMVREPQRYEPSPRSS